MKKRASTRADYVARIQREKAERLINAVQEVARSGDIRPFKERCWAMKAQENKRIQRAKQRREAFEIDQAIAEITAQAFSHVKGWRPKARKVKRNFADDAMVLVKRNPLDLSPAYGITAMHLACQLFATAVQKGDRKTVELMEEVVAILIRLGACPTLTMFDPRSKVKLSCIELCPRKPGSADRIAPKALVAALSASAGTEPLTSVVKIERHAGIAKAKKARREAKAARLEATTPAVAIGPAKSAAAPNVYPLSSTWLNLARRTAAREAAHAAC